MADNELVYDANAEVSNTGKPILGKLRGVCADIIHPTRNDRLYDEAVWKKVFADPIVKEYYEMGGVLGELGHPADREETDMEKVAVCMPEPPKKNDKGQLVGEWDILNTPNGRILKCLCDYGYKMGISSRGSGDTYTDDKGNECIDPESYTFNAFDVVILPAVKSARLQYESITEGLVKKKTLRKSLTEALNKATEDERKVMKETLDELNIDYTDDTENTTGEITDNSSTDLTADNSGVNLEKELKESLRQNAELRKQIRELQGKLSVGYSKEVEQNNLVESLKSENQTLKRHTKAMSASTKQVSELRNKTQEYETKLSEQYSTINTLKENLNSTNEKLEEVNSRYRELQSRSTNKVKALQEQIMAHRESISENEKILNEQVATLKRNSAIKKTEYERKLTNITKLAEQYKQTTKIVVDKYIDLNARVIGCSKQEITNLLRENYSIADIDNACTKLREYNMRINALPFASGKVSNVRATVKESLKPSMLANRDDGDDIDSSLLALARE